MSSKFAGNPVVIPEFTGLQINTAVQALPIPIVLGSPRISVNLIYYNGFNVQYQNVGGKGILGGGKGAQEVEYYATIILAFGEGSGTANPMFTVPPGSNMGTILVIYQDQAVYVPSDYPSNGAYYFDGSATQAPWSYVQAFWPNDARPYKDTAYAGLSNAQLDSAATVPQINIVPLGLYAGTFPSFNTTITISSGQYDNSGVPISYIGNITLGDCDCDPAIGIYEILSNPVWGAGFDPALIDTTTLFTSQAGYDPNQGDTAVSTYCQAVGIGWSLCLNNVETANNVLERLCKNLVVAPVWTGELLKFIPYYPFAQAGNAGYDPGNPLGIGLKYYAAVYDSPLLALTTDYLLQAKDQKSDPITFERVDPMTVKNVVRVDFRDRMNFFNDNVAVAEDENYTELYGRLIDNVGMAKEFTRNEYAFTSAWLQLQRNISVRRRFTFRAGPLFGFLDPMDVINIPDPSNWNNMITVRIISCEDDEEENTTYVAEELSLYAPNTEFKAPKHPPPPTLVTNAPPPDVFLPVIFEPTSSMLTALGLAVGAVIVGTSGGANDALGPNWGGCQIWTSLDDVNYQKLGELIGPSTFGQLAVTLPAYNGANPDTVDVLTVDLSESASTLGSFSAEAASIGASLCVIQDGSGFEVLSYTTATLVSGNTFNLTGLYRGLYNTAPRQFNAGSRFLFIATGQNFFEATLPPQYVGKTFYAKFPSFNHFHQAAQSLADVPAYVYSATGPVIGLLLPRTQISVRSTLRSSGWGGNMEAQIRVAANLGLKLFGAPLSTTMRVNAAARATRSGPLALTARVFTE